MEAQIKPDWITDKQWKANPNVYHWERSRQAMQSIKQSKEQPPLTREQLEQQMINRQSSLVCDRQITFKTK